MSRYVSVTLEHLELERDELLADLRELGLAVESAEHEGDKLLLQGSLECAGEPVDLRLAAGVLDSVEDWGFVRGPSGWRLVCGELDRRSLEQGLVEPLTRVSALRRVRKAARAAGLALDELVEADGTRVVRVRGGS